MSYKRNEDWTRRREVDGWEIICSAKPFCTVGLLSRSLLSVLPGLYLKAKRKKREREIIRVGRKMLPLQNQKILDYLNLRKPTCRDEWLTL